ncbi:M3 family metallopeptidase [Ideonella sp. DXS29W]|uniref:M3 family metallopeptidase n=1 Tax=Ideonella lacteola TaxID=2984193 RepID=A0ABU9BXT1_9BURK
MKKTWMALAVCSLTAAGMPHALAAESAEMVGPAFPDFQTPVQVKQACDAGLKAARTRVALLEKRPASPTWIAEYDAAYSASEDAYGPIGFVSNVHPDPKVRDAAEACDLRWQDFFTSTSQNAKLYRAAKASVPTDDIDREALRQAIESFEDSGVGLPPAQRAKAKQLSNRIGLLGQQFEKNVRDSNTKVEFSEEDLAGVPEGVLKAAKRDAKGRLLLGLDYPTYYPVMERAEKGSTRERMWRAKMNEGGDANLKLLAEIAKLRRDYAKLFGFDSYADFTLRRRMAKNTANTSRFLGDVKQAVTEGERRDIAQMREAKAKHLGLPVEKVTVERWDVPFYTERMRKELYSVDEESFRPYFPPQESLKFVMRIAETMFGIKYTPVPAKLWHPEVQAYAVTDAATGKPLSSLMVDLYPREGKYNHAAVWSYRGGSTLTGRVPQAALVVNFDRKGLTIEELNTLLHEFGHALHSNLSMTRYALNSGTNTQHDFVEAPSQMLEDWVFDRKVLKLFQDVCPSCKQVPDELVDKALAARDFTKGSKTARQHLYASFDLALHSADAPEPMALWAKMEGDTPLGYVPGTKFPAGFSHVAGGYGAGYYGYLWSLVVAMDLRTAFAEDRLSPVVGKRYRDTVLGQGGQRPPELLVKDFLGREMSPKAFFDDLKK